MTRREIPTFGIQVYLCFSFEKKFKFEIVLLTWGEFSDDTEKFRGNMGRRKINRKNKREIVHVLDIILSINNCISYFIYLGYQDHIFFTSPT